MKHTRVQRQSRWQRALGRIAVAALTVAGLSALLFPPAMGTAATGPRTASVISTVKNPTHGTILRSGTTVYALQPSNVACTAKCLKVWPPVLLPQGVSKATAGVGVDASKLGAVPAANGALQITYSGKALYWFAKDKAPGQVKGNVTDEWGKWYSVVTAKPSAGSRAPSTTSAGTGGTAF
jgi:predicted lipoprotein with Yx(FWY)xxD motif